MTDDPRRVGDLLKDVPVTGAAAAREALAGAVKAAGDSASRALAQSPARVVVDVEALRRQAADAQFHAVAWRRFHGASLDDWAEPVRTQLATWAAMEEPPNLLIAGPVGTGKTSAAHAAIRARIADGHEDVFLVPEAEMYVNLRPGGPEDYLADLLAVELLLIDDVASKEPSPASAEALFIITNRRWAEMRPIIATTNHDPRRPVKDGKATGEPSPLEAAVGPAVYSRLVGSGAVVVFLTGTDRRRTRKARS